jgi:hypothetical protein
MYELLGALAFAAIIAGYVLAVVFVRHEQETVFTGRRSIGHDGNASSRDDVNRQPSR